MLNLKISFFRSPCFVIDKSFISLSLNYSFEHFFGFIWDLNNNSSFLWFLLFKSSLSYLLFPIMIHPIDVLGASTEIVFCATLLISIFFFYTFYLTKNHQSFS